MSKGILTIECNLTQTTSLRAHQSAVWAANSWRGIGGLTRGRRRQAPAETPQHLLLQHPAVASHSGRLNDLES